MTTDTKHWQWKKGVSPNPNGRPKGSKNKNTYAYKVGEILGELGYCPFTHLYQMATDETWSKRERTQAAVELCSYVAPKLKSIEIKGEDLSNFNVTLNLTPKETIKKNE
jgi:hypothetical protein